MFHIMPHSNRKAAVIFQFSSLVLLSLVAQSAQAEVDPQIEKGLSISPRQSDVLIEKVSAADLAACTKRIEKRNNAEGLLLLGPNSQPLRWFADTNGDRSIDMWSYFNNGVEVYRDIDSDYNGKVDQFRWFGTAGTRWGIDRNEDGQVDQWKKISAEEVTMEVVAAIKDADEKRFSRILMTAAEVDSLKLGKAKTDELRTRVAMAIEEFKKFAQTQKTVTPQTRWTNFGADKPGVVPAGTDGSENDIVAYENAMAIVESQNRSEQILIGSLIQLDSNQWRATDVPRLVNDGTVLTSTALFFNSSAYENRAMSQAGGGLSRRSQELLKELGDIEQQLSTAVPAKMQSLNVKRAEILEGLIAESSDPEETETWIRQYADEISAATQATEFSGGLQRLQEFITTQTSLSEASKAYLEYRIITTEYSVRVSQESESGFATIQKDFLAKLEQFVTDYPSSVDAADAMLQLGLNAELSADPSQAKKWYQQTAAAFAGTIDGKRAAGAVARLTLEGETLKFSGKTLDGKVFNTEAARSGPIVMHYWATWCDPCKKDMDELRTLQAKYAKAGLRVVGINLDTRAEDAIEFLKANPNKYPWPHIYDNGAFESRMAIDLGVFSVPVTIVMDGKGTVIRSTTHYTPDIETLIEETVNPPKK